MNKVRMLNTVQGAPDGIRVREYKAGEVCRIPDDLSLSLASTFVKAGCAVDAETESRQEPKAKLEPTDNKVVKPKTTKRKKVTP